MSFSEEIRSDVNPFKRGSPLPWLLLAITVVVGATMALVSHSRLVEERVRTARALQEDDEIHARLRTTVAENAQLREETQAAKARQGELEQRAKSLEDQLKASADELAKFKSNPRCVTKK